MQEIGLLVHLLVAALAATQLIELWLEGSIFEQRRETLRQARDDESRAWFSRRTSELLLCAFCLLPWVSLLMVTGLLTAGARLVCYALAAARIGQLINDVRARIVEPKEVDETKQVDEYQVVDN